MEAWELLKTPVTMILFALATGYLMYAWSRSVAPPFIRSTGKTMPYVGGEAIEAQAYQPGYQFFYVALFFTVVHVAALIIALAPADAPLWATVGYLGFIVIAVTVLRWEQ